MAILWEANHETGNLSEWTEGGNGEENSNTGCSSVASNEQANTGTFSIKQISTGKGVGTRLYRYKEYITSLEIFTSDWLYIPQNYTVNANGGAWFNIKQFQSEGPSGTQPFYILGLRTHSGQLRVDLTWWPGLTVNGPKENQSGGQSWVAPIAAPIAQWFNIEARHVYSSEFAGAIQVWQDGAQIFLQEDVRTGHPLHNFSAAGAVANRMVALTCYCDLISPTPVILYRDTAKIGDARINDSDAPPIPPIDEIVPVPPEVIEGTYWQVSRGEDFVNIRLEK